MICWKAGIWVNMLNNPQKRKHNLVGKCRHVGCRKEKITILWSYVLGHATTQQRPWHYWRARYASTLKLLPSASLHRRHLATVSLLDFPWTTNSLSWRTCSCGPVLSFEETRPSFWQWLQQLYTIFIMGIAPLADTQKLFLHEEFLEVFALSSS